MSEWIQGLPAPVRHFAGVVVGTFVLFVVGAVISAGGVTGVEWFEVLKAAADAACVGGAGVLVLYVTPLTDAYGVGKVKPDADPVLPPLPAQHLPEQAAPDPEDDLDIDEHEGIE